MLADGESGFIDFEAYGLSESRLYSLKAVSDIWRHAVIEEARVVPGGAAEEAFVAICCDMPVMLADTDWQRRWMQTWHELYGSGVSLGEIFRFFFRAAERCEADILGDRPQVGRLNLELYSSLRRAITASISCAIELGEQLRDAEMGVQGELTALRTLHDLRTDHAQVAVLSLSLVNRNSFVHLSASDLQGLPSMLAQRLQGVLHAQDRVFAGREGEWLLVMPGIRSMAQPSLAAAHLQRLFAEPLRLLSGRALMMDVAIGAAMMPDHGSTADAVVHAARLARWNLGTSGQSFGWFEDGLSQDWQKRFRMAEELRKALQHETLELYLQPQVDIETKACTGAELLLRWQRENGEWVPPPLVMALIEENGWRMQLTDWLVRNAMRIAADLSAAGIDISLSLNLTAADMLDEDLPELLAQRIETWHIPPERFTLEITESAMLTDRNRCLSIMHRLRALGFRLALDDFGTGYSSLSYLVSLPLNEIKIDRAFVVAMGESIDSLRLVRTIIDLTRDLDMTPLAEGVETVAQRDQLWALGCTLAQGYHYAKPLPLPAFIEWFNARLA